jgi:predicted DNA-binding antitoxin AbrB/MazE fold protein
MTEIIEAVFDGEVLRPVKPVALKPHTRVRLTLEVTDETTDKSATFLQTAQALRLEGPADWSERLDDYLNGKKDLDNV